MAINERDTRNELYREKKLKLRDGNAKAMLENTWVDAHSRAAYEEFNDMVYFDITYLKNQYELPFANFVGSPHPRLIICSHTFREPYPSFSRLQILCSCIMDLLLQYAYPSIATYAKFQILVSMKVSPGGVISFTIGKAIPLTFDDGKLIPQSHVYARILRAVTTISERYDTCMVTGVTLRVFVEGRTTDTFEWEFCMWGHCMTGIALGGILTDQAATMRNALRSTMPETRHRWCIRHIIEKFSQKLGKCKGYNEFKDDLLSAIYDSLFVPEFESSWMAVINKHGLEDNVWLD
ncbi:DNA polymerase, partial [Bienertia sinuspersici]